MEWVLMKAELLFITPDAERLIEKAAKVSYQSKPAITIEEARAFIKKLIGKKHDSVLEHGLATVKLSGVSRALTHQLIRHRLSSYTQKSQRYCDERNLEVVVPRAIVDNEDAFGMFDQAMFEAERSYRELLDLGIKKEDARYVLPNATASEIVVTNNFRQWRKVFTLRLSPHAQDEIRRAMSLCHRLIDEYVPSVFDDFENPFWDEIHFGISDADNDTACYEE